MAFKQGLFSIKGSKLCQENIPHTIPPLLLTQGRLGPWVHWCCWCQILTLPSVCQDSSGQATFFQSSNCPLLVSLCPLEPQLSVLEWLTWKPTLSSTTVVAHPPQGSKCCIFVDAFLLFRPFTLFLVEATLAVITALSLLGYNETSFAHPDLGIFCHSSLQILSGSVRLDEDRQRTSPEVFDWVKVRTLAGPLKDIHSP